MMACGNINSKYLDDISSESEEDFQDNASKKSFSFISEIPVKDMENRLLMSSTASEYVTAVTSIEPCMEPPLKKQKKIDQNERCIKETPKLPRVVGRKLEFEENGEDCNGSSAKLMVWWRENKSRHYRAGWAVRDDETLLLKLTSLDGWVYPFGAVDVVFVNEIPKGSIVFKLIDIHLQGVKLLDKLKCNSPTELTKLAYPGARDIISSEVGQILLHEEQIHQFIRKGIACYVHSSDVKLRWGRRLQKAYHQTSKQKYIKKTKIFQEDIVQRREEVSIEVGSKKIRYMNDTVAVKRKYCEIEET